MPRPSTTPAVLPFPLLALFSLITLSTITSALPLANRGSQAAAVPFEPLFRYATADVGPRSSLERLRLRRAARVLESTIATRQTVENPKAKRALGPNILVAAQPATASPVVNAKTWNQRPSNPKLAIRSFAIPVQNPKKRSLDAVLAKRALDSVVPNPKAKRSLSVEGNVVLNPKARRSISEDTGATPLVRRRRPRNFLAAFADFANGVKARRALAPLDLATATPSTRAIRNPKIKRASTILGGLGGLGAQIVLPNIIPNPKSPNFASIVASVTSMLSLPTSTATLSSSAPASSAMITSQAAPSSATPSSSAKASSALSSSSRLSSSSTSSKPSSTSTFASVAPSSSVPQSSTASSTSASATPTASSWPTGDMISAAYYPDWNGDLLPPSQVDFSLFDLIDYAFAVPTSNYGVAWTSDNSGPLLKELVKYAHGNNTKVLISVGGWTGSTYFSGAVSNSANIAKFVKNLVKMVNLYDVDGVDIDWEYPGGGGNAGNEQSSSDTANYLVFLTALRAALGPDKRISTCVTQSAFLGADGSPLANVTGFADVLDNILVMNYDVWGASSTPGPNAPLSDACPNSQQPNANELSSIKAWTAAGMPASKILMGVPSYGYISSSTATSLVHKRSVLDVAGEGAHALPKRDTGLSNRERAVVLHAESQKSHMHRSFELGQARRAERDEATRVAELAARNPDADSHAKRDSIIVCPNDHSGNPCAGIMNQTIGTINWNPLGNGSSDASNTTTASGVFSGSAGAVKIGNGNLGSISGNQIQFNQLLSYGVIVADGTAGNYKGANGYTNAWDSCSSTPYLYDVSRSVVITYDDPTSMTLKAQMAKAQKVGGVKMWDMSGDTASWTLVNAYRNGMGLN